MNSSQHPRIRPWATGLCVMVLFGGALLWILNLDGIIPGSWAASLSALCTICCVLFAFLGWQASSVRMAQAPQRFPTLMEEWQRSQKRAFGLDKHHGAIVSTARKRDLGAAIHLCRGFIAEPFNVKMVASIGEYGFPTSVVFAALFPALEPGNYTLFFEQSGRKQFVTVRSKEVAIVDWHREYGEVK